MEENIFDSWLCNKYIAHRGLHTDKLPENSLGAYENAINQSYPIEIDVRIISDGTLIVLHDDDLKRVCGKDKYASQLKKEDLADCKLFGTDYTIPTLEEVLNFVDGRTPLLIEIKQLEKVGELERKMWELLKDYKGEYAVQSFNPFSLEWFKKNAPQVWRGQLSCSFKGEKLSFVKKVLLKRLKLNGISSPDFISYCAEDLPNKWVKKHENLPILAWTVRSQQKYLKAVQYCDNIIFEDFVPKI